MRTDASVVAVMSSLVIEITPVFLLQCAVYRLLVAVAPKSILLLMYTVLLCFVAG